MRGRRDKWGRRELSGVNRTDQQDISVTHDRPQHVPVIVPIFEICSIVFPILLDAVSTSHPRSGSGRNCFHVISHRISNINLW